MDTMKIKNDKARKEWLAGLRVGDVVAVLDENGAVTAVDAVSWSRYSRSWGVGGGRYTEKTGKRAGRAGWIIPATEEMKAATAKRKSASLARDRLRGTTYWDWNKIGDDQVLAAAAILWPESAEASRG